MVGIEDGARVAWLHVVCGMCEGEDGEHGADEGAETRHCDV